MIGGDKTPFRAPCAGGSGGFTFNGPILRIGSSSASSVDAYGNTTTMLDHCGATVTAKERLYPTDTCGEDVCTTDCNDCPGGFDLTINTPEPPAISANTWLKMGKVSIEQLLIGGKWIQAFKCWQGEFGFNDTSAGLDCATGLILSNIRYRTRGMVGSYFIDDNDDPPGAGPGCTYTTERNYTVVKNSGVITSGACSDTKSLVDCLDTPPFPDDFGYDPRCSNEVPSVATYFALCNTDLSSGPGGVSGRTVGDDGETLLSVTSTRTDTSYTWHIKRQLSDLATNPRATILDYTGSITLSDPYTMSDVLVDAALLASEWQLTDGLKHPFRTDRHTTVAPLVLRNEVTPPVSPNVWQACDWTDPNAADCDGSIIGKPLAAGYGQPVGGNPRGVFDKDHENFKRRNCVLGVGWTQANESRGAFTPGYLPANAQKWTDDLQATNLWGCAFINADINGVYLQKWAEAPIKRPSINFARPYGPDKFALDETAVYFMQSKVGSLVTLKDTDFNVPGSLPFTTADIVGGTSVSGFYAVTAVGTNTVTLGAKVYDVPGGWNTPSGDGSACFGKLRNPNAPGMDFIDATAEVGGRVAVTVADGVSVRTITTATVQKYLSITTPENVDILDASMTVLASNVAATRVDDTHFTVATAFATITTAAWIIPHGTKYKFADSRSKGDYVFRTWLVDIDSSAVISTSQIDSCVGSSPCGTPMVVVTPNGETPASGNRHDFPTTINHGEAWFGQVQFWMVDPFWQQPHKPVAVPAGLGTLNPGVDMVLWGMDDGTCNENSKETGGGGETIFHLFYPLHPFVEARCTVPAISGDTPPAPPVDITAVATRPAQAGIGDVDGPLVDAITLPEPIWSTYLKEKACVDAAGTFAADYEANGT